MPQKTRAADWEALEDTIKALNEEDAHELLKKKNFAKCIKSPPGTGGQLKITGLESASCEQWELALESVPECRRESELMLELHENYDSEVQCSNRFETLAKSLVAYAFPSEGIHGVRGGLSFLHRAAATTDGTEKVPRLQPRPGF